MTMRRLMTWLFGAFLLLLREAYLPQAKPIQGPEAGDEYDRNHDRSPGQHAGAGTRRQRFDRQDQFQALEWW